MERQQAALPLLQPLPQPFQPLPQPQPLANHQQTLLDLNETGLRRGERPIRQIFLSSVLGGSLLCWGASAWVLLAGGSAEALSQAPQVHAVLTALIFPIGLSSIVLSGSDLLTSNMLYATLPMVSGDPRRSDDAKLRNLATLWGVSLAGNLLGCVGMAYFTSALFMAKGAGACAVFAKAVAVKKTSGTLAATTAKAVGANWLVNLAVFQASTAATTPGKMACLWLPITAFVALGLEHCVANMYLLPLGIFCGADISGVAVLSNLVPVICGNAVGASVCVGWLHWNALMPAKVTFPPNH